MDLLATTLTRPTSFEIVCLCASQPSAVVAVVVVIRRLIAGTGVAAAAAAVVVVVVSRMTTKKLIKYRRHFFHRTCSSLSVLCSAEFERVKALSPFAAQHWAEFANVQITSSTLAPTGGRHLGRKTQRLGHQKRSPGRVATATATGSSGLMILSSGLKLSPAASAQPRADSCSLVPLANVGHSARQASRRTRSVGANHRRIHCAPAGGQ